MLACGGSKKAMLTQTEIETAQKNGNLSVLYKQMTETIEQSRGSTREEAITLRAQISQLLIDDKLKQVDSVLETQKSKPDSVSRVSLLALQQSVSEMQSWSATEHTRATSRVNNALNDVNRSIKALVKESETKSYSAAQKIDKLKQAARLAGDGQAESKRYMTEYEKLRSQLIRLGNDALAKRSYVEAMKYSEDGLIIEPESIQFSSMLSQASTGLFENEFRQAIENGQPDEAYQLLLKVADKPVFKQLRKSMYKSIYVLANYFASSAQKHYKKGDFYSAYEDFSKGRNVQTQLGVQQGFIQEKRYLDQLMLKAIKTKKAEGQKLALLRVIQEFDQSYPKLENQLVRSTSIVSNRAKTKLSITDFKEITFQSSVISSIGRRIASKLEKILLSSSGKDVLMVTKVEKVSPVSYEGLSLIIDGEILQAAVESSSNRGKRLKTVQTGVERIETEAYKEWAESKKGEAPAQYHETPINEQVELTVVHTQKQAVAEVAFRVIDPRDGSILLTDHFVKESQFTGESINELEKGMYHQPYVPAKLPSDIKAMDKLATELADKLGDKIGNYLKSTELVFYQKYKQAVTQKQKQPAIELLANALVIGEAKGEDKETKVWYKELKLMVLK